MNINLQNITPVFIVFIKNILNLLYLDHLMRIFTEISLNDTIKIDACDL